MNNKNEEIRLTKQGRKIYVIPIDNKEEKEYFIRLKSWEKIEDWFKNKDPDYKCVYFTTLNRFSNILNIHALIGGNCEYEFIKETDIKQNEILKY